MELATLQDGEFWELNEEGQLVMGDGCPEPALETFGPEGKGLNYHLARTMATRICYLSAQGTVVVEGDDSPIPEGVNVISERGLVTLEEYRRKNKGQFEKQKYIWTESGKNPLVARRACWYLGPMHWFKTDPGHQTHDRGFRRVLRVSLNFSS